MNVKGPPLLGGEANPNSWHFQRTDEVGPLPNPTGHTFPLLTHDERGRWSVVGTGFYVTNNGLFVTARHVIEAIAQNGEQLAPLVILHPHSPNGLFGSSEVIFRPIRQCWLSATADIAFGEAATLTKNATGEFLKHWCWPLCWVPPSVDEAVATFAFPRHLFLEGGKIISLAPDLYPGKVAGLGEFRDRILMPFPFIEIDCRVHGAASGGPIGVWGRQVVGVNCSEVTGSADEKSGPAFGTQICCLADAFLEEICFSGESGPRSVSFQEFVDRGLIHVEHYKNSEKAMTGSGRVLRLDRVAATASRPHIAMTYSA